ncbi:uncharacterized protein LOC119133820 isoform X2 [Syngnathus acus]|uniref:uncharacterized protein LOC119133820 isoform X2 n=1 Tax=Syngnathus acus TaxID=161584 RepID=UPI001885B08D|nr:uncharacterized protein LOC119133820 isoform X2 [Syngnathus acus]
MDLNNFLKVLIPVMIASCLLICIIWFFIYLCSNVKYRYHRDSKDKVSTYQERKQTTPPLPPRTQFLLAEAQSYENITEVPEVEHELDMADLLKQSQTLDPNNFQDYDQIPYDQLDYVEVEEQPQEPYSLVPSYEDVPKLAEDAADDYDDVEDSNQDYDDVK